MKEDELRAGAIEVTFEALKKLLQLPGTAEINSISVQRELEYIEVTVIDDSMPVLGLGNTPSTVIEVYVEDGEVKFEKSKIWFPE